MSCMCPLRSSDQKISPPPRGRMGVAVSHTDTPEEQKRRHQLAEKIIAEDKRKSTSVFKLLLLGTGDSGKSTIVKQMRILHKNGFDQDELIRQRTMVSWNVVHSIATIVKAMRDLAIKYEDAEREGDAESIVILERDWVQNGAVLTFEDWKCLKKLWGDSGVKACYLRANEYQLSDSTKYFCDDMERLSSKDYVPNEQDMLRIRVATTGIVEIEFTLRGLTLNVIDVGGQRSQRKKWIHCFENVNGLIFVAAASEYNQVLLEDCHVNRMHESMKLFSTVINSNWFAKSNVVLFLNKKDLFEEKIKTHPLTITFPEYTGPSSYEPAMAHVQHSFEKEKQDAKKMIYTHRTCATDTRNIEFVMDACFDMMLSKNMARSGLY